MDKEDGLAQLSDASRRLSYRTASSGPKTRNLCLAFTGDSLRPMTAGENLTDPRLQALLSACIDLSFGTLWWIREDLWKERQPGYSQESERIAHPGLSVRSVPPAGLFELVPLLHGTSGYGPVAVSGLTRRQPLKTSYFGRLLFPAQIPVVEFTRPARDADPDELTGPWYRRARTSPNWEKLRITSSEAAALEQWQATISSTRKNSFKEDSSSSRSVRPPRMSS